MSSPASDRGARSSRINKRHGIFVWQNDHQNHVIDHFVGYHNGGAGVSQGAYRNRYRYSDCILLGNAEADILLHALSAEGSGSPLTFDRVRCDAAGFERCSFTGYRKSALRVADLRKDGPDLIDLVDCTFDGNELWLQDDVHPDTVVRVGSAEARRRDQVGLYKPDWNASVLPPLATA